MDITSLAKEELINKVRSTLVTPNIKTEKFDDEDVSLYQKFISDVNAHRDASIELPIGFATENAMFDLIKSQKVFVDNSVKFKMHFTTKKPSMTISNSFVSKFTGNEFKYAFLDNHPGILNVNEIREIPIDYEGLMAVPPTILEYKHLRKFNIHKVIYNPKYNGKFIYKRVVISNKVAVAE